MGNITRMTCTVLIVMNFLKKGTKTFKLIFFYCKIFTNKGVNFVWEESIFWIGISHEGQILMTSIWNVLGDVICISMIDSH